MPKKGDKKELKNIGLLHIVNFSVKHPCVLDKIQGFLTRPSLAKPRSQDWLFKGEEEEEEKDSK